MSKISMRFAKTSNVPRSLEHTIAGCGLGASYTCIPLDLDPGKVAHSVGDSSGSARKQADLFQKIRS